MYIYTHWGVIRDTTQMHVITGENNQTTNQPEHTY